MSTLELIGATQAAEMLGLTRAGLDRRVKTGKLAPLATLGTRRIRVFDRAEIEALAAKEGAGA